MGHENGGWMNDDQRGYYREKARQMAKNARDCDGCKYWSELCAESIGCGPIVALCLCSDSPHYSRMVNDGCEHFVYGKSIDCPCH